MEEEKRYHHGDLRSALVKSGLEILAEEGVNDLSLRKVALRAGVSHAAPYRHFADKESLLVAIAEEGTQMLSDQMQAGANLFPSEPEKQLLEAGWAYVKFGLEHPDYLRVMFGGVIERQKVDDANTFGLLVNIIRACQYASIVREGDTRELALSAWAQVHGLTTLLISRMLSMDTFYEQNTERVVRSCLRTFFIGLRAV